MIRLPLAFCGAAQQELINAPGVTSLEEEISLGWGFYSIPERLEILHWPCMLEMPCLCQELHILVNGLFHATIAVLWAGGWGSTVNCAHGRSFWSFKPGVVSYRRAYCMFSFLYSISFSTVCISCFPQYLQCALFSCTVPRCV